MHSYDLIENYLKNLSTVIIDKSWISICAFSSNQCVPFYSNEKNNNFQCTF